MLDLGAEPPRIKPFCVSPSVEEVGCSWQSKNTISFITEFQIVRKKVYIEPLSHPRYFDTVKSKAVNDA